MEERRVDTRRSMEIRREGAIRRTITPTRWGKSLTENIITCIESDFSIEFNSN